MAVDRAEYMREYRARKRAEAEAAGLVKPRKKKTEPEPKPKDPNDEKPIPERHVRGLSMTDKNVFASKDEVSKAISHATRYIKADPCKSDEEVAERINQYFKDCERYGEIPKWENLALCLGITRTQAWNVATGRQGSPARQRMMQRAKDILSAVDAELVSTGKIPQVVYIFRAKNFYGMADSQEVVVTPNNAIGEAESVARLTEKYSTLIEIDDE